MAIEKKFVREGYVKASLDEYFAKQLNRAGYGGMEINRTPMGTQITVYAEKPGMVIGKAGKVIRKLTRDIDRMYDMDNPQIDAQEVRRPELNAQMMATRLASSIERGWYFRKAGHNAMRAIMNAGALGCEIVISGKLTGARSRTEKIVEGYIKHAGKPVDDIVDDGFAVAIKKLGTLGCKVRIIPPGAVLPDSFKLKDIAPEPISEIAKVQPKADIKKLVKEEASGEVAEVEEAFEEESVEKAEKSDKAIVENEVSVDEPSCSTADSGSTEVLENEERREIDGVWQHKHAGHDYWHPTARIHREG
ncbi:30S ribosomal protein S3 [Methanomethylovorans sp.]|uniref:30S ribosomal protein S3 n=1 Tax=Methanomethylovorans sp. TaxID=2758717 RepID=UPI00351C0CB0